MAYDYNCRLWPNNEEKFFHNLALKPIKQGKNACLRTVLAILTDKDPDYFLDKINTQNPLSWSDALKPLGYKLAYLPADCRKLGFYIEELVVLNDLFLVCYYGKVTEENPSLILADPDQNGFVCPSHIEILWQNELINPATGEKRSALAECPNRHTKRLFRVVPADYQRGL